MNPVTKINISENLNQCMTCDHTGNEWAEHPKTKECVCPELDMLLAIIDDMF